jgi:hypothetical protein
MIMPSKSAGYRHLSRSLGFISQQLRWGPQRLSDIDKDPRLEKSQELLLGAAIIELSVMGAHCDIQ